MMITASTVRLRLTTGVTVTSAGILALGLVTVPPQVDGMRTDGVGTGVHRVELTAFALAPKLPSAALVDTLMAGGGADITTAAARTPLTMPPALQPSGAAAQAINAPPLPSQQQAPQINLNWIPLLVNTLFQWTPDFLKPFVGGVLLFVVAPVLAVIVNSVALIYDPIVKTINRVLDALGLPLLPVFFPDPPATTQANKTTVPTLTTNSTTSNPVVPAAATSTPSGEALSSKKPAKTVRRQSLATAPKTGGTPLTEANEGLPTNPGTPTDQTLSTTTAKLRPLESRSPADVGQRPRALRRPNDPGLAARPTVSSDNALAVAASSRVSKSARNSQGSSSSGGNSDGSK